MLRAEEAAGGWGGDPMEREARAGGVLPHIPLTCRGDGGENETSGSSERIQRPEPFHPTYVSLPVSNLFIQTLNSSDCADRRNLSATKLPAVLS